MPTLYSYCIRYDIGSAPNPFWGLCTLAICKPNIRQSANIGDWVVGTGSAVSPVGNISDKVVYAMRVTQKMTMEDYDRFTRSKLPRKIPLMTSIDPRRRSGDSIYDFSTSPPLLRPSVHGEENQKTDLKGGWVLLSNHYFYFGDSPVDLPEELLEIVKKGPGHKANFDPYDVDAFIHWIHSFGYPPATLIGKPQLEVEVESSSSVCGPRDRQEDIADMKEPDSPPSNCC
ncbi:MAG: Nmad2 family putative nucleotide modification protein [Ktedonobacteraceae bacterium]